MIIKLTPTNNLAQPNGILDQKKGYDKTHKNIQNVYEGFLWIAWKCMRFEVII